ncbi:entericidin A/B family lipoprotein [Oxalobacteraceae bacterium OM1]|nr:entericidin A/B family lipoprotein [Oxalobacteraceae bacterium OM1]
MKNAAFVKVLFVLLGAMAVLSACNTMQGIGKDVKRAGEVVENAAKK